MSGEYKLDMPVAWFVQVEGIGSTLNVASEMAKHLLDQAHDFVIYGFFEVKCQLLIVYFVGFGCQPTILLHTIRQSFEPSYTQIQAVLVNFF